MTTVKGAASRLTRSPLLQFLDLLGTQLAGFVLEHHGNAVAYGIGEARRLGDELLPVLIVGQRPFGDRTDQYLEQLAIHGFSPRQGRPAPAAPPRSREATTCARPRKSGILPHL